MKTTIGMGASALALAFGGAAWADTAPKDLSFSISFPAAKSAEPIDGRVILMLSPREGVEPRTLVNPDEPLKSPYLFSVQVEGLKPGQAQPQSSGLKSQPPNPKTFRCNS